jgi:hypothetical protein
MVKRIVLMATGHLGYEPSGAGHKVDFKCGKVGQP